MMVTMVREGCSPSKSTSPMAHGLEAFIAKFSDGKGYTKNLKSGERLANNYI